MKDRGLLKYSIVCTQMICEYIGQVMSIIKDKEKIDGYTFRFTKCHQKVNARSYSIFKDCKITMPQLLRCIFICFLERNNIDEAAQYCSISGMSVKTIYRFLKSQISQHIDRHHNNNPLCHISNYPNDQPVCEVDKSLFTHLKGEGDVYQQQCWIFGASERLTQRFICFVVSARQFISTFIMSNPQRKTIVYTDSAKWYQFMGEQNSNYEHRPLNHALGFGEGERTTNNIESLWGQMKSIGRFNQGLNFETIEQVQFSINEIQWRLLAKNEDQIQQLADLLAENYQINRQQIIEFS